MIKVLPFLLTFFHLFPDTCTFLGKKGVLRDTTLPHNFNRRMGPSSHMKHPKAAVDKAVAIM